MIERMVNKEEYYENGSIPWLRSGEVSQGSITKSEMFITELGLKNSSAKIFPINTVLVAMYGATAGQVGILKFKSSTNQAICGILPNEKLIPEFLFWVLKSQREVMTLQAGGGAQPNISQNIIQKLKIPLPPIETQQQIVSELDGYSSIIAGAKQIVANWKPKIDIDPSWEMVKLGDVCEIKSGGTPSRNINEYWSGSIPWVGSAVCKDKEVYKAEEFITELGLKNSSARLFEIDTTLIALVGATIGKTGFLKFQSSTNQNIAGLYPNNIDNLNPIYLFYICQTLYDEFTRLGDFKMANLSFVKNRSIPLPPLETQQQIVAQIEAEQALIESAKKLIEIYEQKIKEVIAKIWEE